MEPATKFVAGKRDDFCVPEAIQASTGPLGLAVLFGPGTAVAGLAP